MPRTGLGAEQLRRKAIDIAEAVICRNGAERLKITDVARHLGVSHAALYSHFADREALMDAVSRRWLDRVDGELGRIASKKTPVEQRLTDWFLALHRLKREKVRSAPELYRAFNRSADKMRPFIGSHLEAMRRQLNAILASGIARGEWKHGNLASAVKILFEATAAFHHPRLVLEHIDQDRRKDLRRLLNVLVTGLQRAGGR